MNKGLVKFYNRKSKTKKSKGAPDLGEHTREIMKNFGYKDEEIDDFFL